MGGLAVLEHDERRNAHDVELASKIRVLIDVDLGDGDLVAVLASHLVEDGGEHFARATPLGPEVHHHGLVRGSNLFGKVGLVQGVDGVGHGVVSLDDSSSTTTQGPLGFPAGGGWLAVYVGF